MIVDDDLPVPLKNINSNSKGNVSEKEKFKNYLNSLEKIIIDHSFLLLGKDQNSDILYVLSNPLLILNSITFEVIEKISYPDKIKLDDYSKIVYFSQSNQNFTLIHSKDSIFIFPLESDRSNYIEQKLNFLKQKETIVKIHSINNQFNFPYFILVSSTSKIYFLKLKIIKNELSIEFEELNEKINFLRKFISNFVPSYETSKIFILNPFSYTKYLINNKKNNILFLFNENYLKKIDFTVTDKGIEPEVKII